MSCDALIGVQGVAGPERGLNGVKGLPTTMLWVDETARLELARWRGVVRPAVP